MKDSVPAFDPYAEGALARFDRRFVEGNGPETVFVKSLSDLWTIALAQLLSRHELRAADKHLKLYSNGKAVDALKALCQGDEGLKIALYQEPFGFASTGSIERAFCRAYGTGRYGPWREALEHEDYQRCSDLIRDAGKAQEFLSN